MCMSLLVIGTNNSEKLFSVASSFSQHAFYLLSLQIFNLGRTSCIDLWTYQEILSLKSSNFQPVRKSRIVATQDVTPGSNSERPNLPTSIHCILHPHQ